MLKRVLIAILLFVSLCLELSAHSLQVQKFGCGKQSILFIPGFACSGDVWKETIETLRNDYTCYTFTMPGFAGASPEENPSFEDWKQQIIRFIEEEHIEKPILVGHSMGGGMSLAVAACKPDLLNSVVVVDALPCLSALYNADFKSFSEADCINMVQWMKAMSDEQFEKQQRLGAATQTTDSLLFERLVEWGTASDRQTYARMFCDYSNVDLRPVLGQISVPVLVLLEPVFKNMSSVIMQQFEKLSSLQVEYAHQGLHFIMYDDKEWFIAQLKNFLNKQK